MFKRIGTPVNLDIVTFKTKGTTNVKCSSCGSIVGKKNGDLVKLAGSDVVVVSPEKYICPKCGKTNSCSKE